MRIILFWPRNNVRKFDKKFVKYDVDRNLVAFFLCIYINGLSSNFDQNRINRRIPMFSDACEYNFFGSVKTHNNLR